MPELFAPPPPQIVAVPSDRLWFDPRLLNVATYPQFTTLAMTLGVVRPLCVPNPQRWGLGFGGITGGTTLNLAPWPDVGTFPFLSGGGAATVPFLTLFNYGPLVSNGWWGSTTATVNIRLIELLRV